MLSLGCCKGQPQALIKLLNGLISSVGFNIQSHPFTFYLLSSAALKRLIPNILAAY